MNAQILRLTQLLKITAAFLMLVLSTMMMTRPTSPVMAETTRIQEAMVPNPESLIRLSSLEELDCY